VTSDGNRFRCLAADPPWNERGGGKIKRGADRHYPLLRPHEILEAIVRAPLWRPAKASHLWLWATMGHLDVALGLMAALGYRYKTHAVWVKASQLEPGWRLQRPGLGQYLRGTHELLLLGTRGVLKSQSRRVPSVILAPRGAHSQKPAAAYQAIEQISPGPRAELFATMMRPGWATWGVVDGHEILTDWESQGESQ
jgi:N6-adenosine-specific RNA methylase IME4